MDEATFDNPETVRRSDMRLIEQAANHRWDITDNIRQAALLTMGQIIADPKAKRRDKIAAARTLAAMERQNQADDHKSKPERQININVTPDQLNAMTDEELDALERRMFSTAD